MGGFVERRWRRGGWLGGWLESQRKALTRTLRRREGESAVKQIRKERRRRRGA